jgi:hypothetical protein
MERAGTGDSKLSLYYYPLLCDMVDFSGSERFDENVYSL